MRFTSDIGLGMKFDIIHIFREINISIAISKTWRGGGGGGEGREIVQHSSRM